MSFVMLPPEQTRGYKLYKGYFLYYILKDKVKKLRAYYFFGYPKKVYKKLREQFKDHIYYDYQGSKVVRAMEFEKNVED